MVFPHKDNPPYSPHNCKYISDNVYCIKHLINGEIFETVSPGKDWRLFF